MISVVIPIDLGRRPISLLRRLNRLLADISAQGVSVAIGHNERGGVFDCALKKICEKYRAQLVSNSFYSGQVNSAVLRNAAMLKVDTPFTLLMDADLYLQADVLFRMRETVANRVKPFQIIPCLYLSRYGSRALLRGRTSPDALLRDYLQFKRASFLHMAVPSSVTLFRTEDFERVGRFDDQFVGHGYEDLDFLLRLAWLHEEIPRDKAVLIDVVTRAPLFNLGFRGELARLSLPALLDGSIAFHLWHSTKRDAYYNARNRNAEVFQRKNSAEISASGDGFSKPDLNVINLDLIADWQAMCRRRGVNPRNYSMLFDNRPSHVDRFDTLIRRLKFIVGRY